MSEQGKGIPVPLSSDGKEVIRVRHGDVIMRFGEKNIFFYTIKDSVGIHARPAGALVKLAKKYKSEIRFSVGDKSAKADSILALMSLGAKQGTRLKIEVHGADEDEALDAFRAFLYENL